MLADEARRDTGHSETEYLLHATYWFRPILSELIGAATESATVNRDRAPSGSVKVVVTNQPHPRPNAGIDLASGVSALLYGSLPVGRVRLHRVSLVSWGAAQLPRR